MTDTTFVDNSTVIVSSWLNDINAAIYRALGSGGVAPTTPAQVKANLGISGTGVPLIKIAVISDSTGAQNPNMPMPWPIALEYGLTSIGAPCQVFDCSADGMTFNRAVNGFAGSNFGTNTAVQQAISYSPDIVLVSIGNNDTIINVESRTLAQVEADAALTFSTLRASLPSAKIIYVPSYWHDHTNYATPGTTLLNQGTLPYLFALRSTGILTNLYCPDVLSDSVSVTTKTNFGNWTSLDSYIKTLTSSQGMDFSFSKDYWRIARMGGLITDGLHPTAVASILEAAYVIKGFKSSFFATIFPHLMSNNLGAWDDPDTLFTTMFTASGATWVNTYAVNSEAVRSAFNYDLNPDTWYLPYPMQVEITTNAGTGAADIFMYNINNAAPLSTVYVSIDGAAFITTGQTTDSNGIAQNAVSGQTMLSITTSGIHTVRYKVGTMATGTMTWNFNTTTVVSIASGGTGATTAAAGLAALGGAAITQAAWTPVTYLNSWVDFGAPYYGAAFMKDTLGFVHLRGIMKNGTAGAAAFQLPVGYRPTSNIAGATVANNVFGFWGIDTSGNFVPGSTSSNASFGLDSITFWPGA